MFPIMQIVKYAGRLQFVISMLGKNIFSRQLYQYHTHIRNSLNHYLAS